MRPSLHPVRVIRKRGRYAAALIVALVPLATVGAAIGAGRGEAAPPVTLIGDSVPDSLAWAPARAILSRGVRLAFDAATCRRTEAPSCRVAGSSAPPTLIRLVDGMGHRLGSTVIVMIGYNDPAADYRKTVGDAIDALDHAGVQHVLWLDLRAVRRPYLAMNAAIASWETSHPELTVLRWNAYSRSHLDWFQADGLHPNPDGAIALATFIHSSLVDLGVLGSEPAVTSASATPRILSTRLPAREGVPFATSLAATGGKGPYRWKAMTKLPRGFELAHDGLLAGVPRSGAGAFAVTFEVADAAGKTATRSVVLSVSG